MQRKFAEIEWLDAVAYDRVGEDTESKSPSELLHAVKSYGYILSEDAKAIILTYEDSGDDKSFIVIPKKWIKSQRIIGRASQSTARNVPCGASCRRRLSK